jgi:RNA polymerase sigma-70 factor (ECF subfamily)
VATLPPAPDRRDDDWTWLEGLYRAHRSQLYRFALGILRSPDDAEDATQITLLNAYGSLARGRRPSHPRAWLFAIALNACRRLLGQRRRLVLVSTAEGEPPAASPTPDLVTGADISRAMESLPPAQRETFMLRELRGLSYAEVGEMLGVSAEAAESLLARARRRLRQQLAPEDRRPLFGLPGLAASLRALVAPGMAKVAGIAAVVAIVPAVALVPEIGLAGDEGHARSTRVFISSGSALDRGAAAPFVSIRPAAERRAGQVAGAPARALHRASPAAPTRVVRPKRPGLARPAGAPAVDTRTAPTRSETTAASPPRVGAVEVSVSTTPATGASVRQRPASQVSRPPAPRQSTQGPTTVVEQTVATVKGAVDDLSSLPTSPAPLPVPSIPDVSIPTVSTPDVQAPPGVPDPQPVVDAAQGAAQDAVSSVESTVSSAESTVSSAESTVSSAESSVASTASSSAASTASSAASTASSAASTAASSASSTVSGVLNPKP